MDSETILKSHILDILFENRNKEYGAYALRKDYNRHVAKSLLGLFLIIMGLLAWQIFHKEAIFNIVPPAPKGPVVEASPLPEPKFKEENSRAIMSSNIINPRLVDHIRPDSTHQAHLSPIGNTSDPATGTNNNTVQGDSTTKGPALPLEPVKPIEPIKPIGPANFAEVMPEFPGGLNALIRFLKHNLRTPRDLEENEEANVLVRFVVSFDGALSGFEVTRSGGGDFDREVLRVLTKMPKWVPGKTHGENVSVYYTVPVKFTAQPD
jgi:periplasmic protein TonB